MQMVKPMARTKNKAQSKIDPAAPWLANVDIAEHGTQAESLAGLPSRIARTWYYLHQAAATYDAKRRELGRERVQAAKAGGDHHTDTEAANWLRQRADFRAHMDAQEAHTWPAIRDALLTGNATFFRKLAAAVEHCATFKGNPVDPAAFALLTYSNAAEGITIAGNPEHDATGKQIKPITRRSDAPIDDGEWLTKEKARQIASNATGRQWRVSEVKRLCDRLGIRLQGDARKRRRVQPKAQPTPKPATPKPPQPKPAQAMPARRIVADGKDTAGATQRALVAVGVPPSFVYGKGTFWNRRDLSDLLDIAAKYRREAIRRHHPDKGGDANQQAAINLAWDTIERQFARHGYHLTP